MVMFSILNTVRSVDIFSYFFYLFATSLAFSNNLIEMLACWVGVNVSLYALFIKGSVQSVEAGLKYFLVGLLVTCILFFSTVLYSIEYFSFDLSYFNYLATYGLGGGVEALGLTFTQRVVLVSIVISFLFKMGSFPFHFYVADLYQSLRWDILYVYTIPLKVIVFSVLLKILISLGSAGDLIGPVVVWSGIGSAFVGSLASVRQVRVRRFWAYSYLSSLGFILLSLMFFNLGAGFSSYVAKIYFITYLITWHAIAYIFSTLRLANLDGTLEEVVYLSQLPNVVFWKKSEHSVVLSVCLFSLMGLPPSLGFFSKLLVYLQIFENSNLLTLAVLLLLTPISGFGYLRLLTCLLVSKNNKALVETRTLSKTCGFFTGWETVLVIFLTPAFAVFLPLLHWTFSAIAGEHTDFGFSMHCGPYAIFSQLVLALGGTFVTFSLLLLSNFQWLV